MDLTVGPNDRSDALRRKFGKLKDLGRDDIEWLDSSDDIKRKAPHLKEADIDGWRGLWCENGGWVAARSALSSVAVECRRLGVKYASGPSGAFKALVLDDKGRCRGVETEDETRWEADVVVLAAGAWSPVLVDLEGQCESKVSSYQFISHAYRL